MTDDAWKLPRKVNTGGDAGRRFVWRASKPARNQGSREVIVRVTGRTRNPTALMAQLAYNTRKGDLAGELSNGRILHGMSDMKELRDRWVADNSAYAISRVAASQSVGVVLSMPAGTPSQAVAAATREWAVAHLSPVTEWFAVQHADRRHFHSHVAVRSVQNDGYRVRATLDDIQEWRETFARSLGNRGIQAEATPRREKLLRIEAERQDLRHQIHELPQEKRPSVPKMRLEL